MDQHAKTPATRHKRIVETAESAGRTSGLTRGRDPGRDGALLYRQSRARRALPRLWSEAVQMHEMNGVGAGRAQYCSIMAEHLPIEK